MPVHHVVTFTWVDDLPEGHVDAVSAALAGLPAAIPSIRSYRFGPDLGISGTAHYAVMAEFDDVDGYLEYRDHPVHQQFIADHITGKLAGRSAVQFVTE